MKKIAIVFSLVLLTIAPVYSRLANVSLGLGFPQGAYIEYELGLTSSTSLGVSYGSFNGDLTSKGTSYNYKISSILTTWRSYNQTFQGLFWGVGAGTINTKIKTNLVDAKGDLFSVFLEAGYNLDIIIFKAGMSAQLHYVSGDLTFAQGSLANLGQKPTGVIPGFKVYLNYNF